MTKRQELEAFRDAVRLRLHDLGRSQAWLARELGVTPQAAGEWFTTRVPSRERVVQIEDALGVPGQLCPLVGYLRADAPVGDCTVDIALSADPLLSEVDRRTISALYHSLRTRGRDGDGVGEPQH